MAFNPANWIESILDATPFPVSRAFLSHVHSLVLQIVAMQTETNTRLAIRGLRPSTSAASARARARARSSARPELVTSATTTLTATTMRASEGEMRERRTTILGARGGKGEMAKVTTTTTTEGGTDVAPNAGKSEKEIAAKSAAERER